MPPESDPTLRQQSGRCSSCGAWASSDPDGEPICCNERCGESWQTTKHQFETSLLGAAVRDAGRQKGTEDDLA